MRARIVLGGSGLASPAGVLRRARTREESRRRCSLEEESGALERVTRRKSDKIMKRDARRKSDGTEEGISNDPDPNGDYVNPPCIVALWIREIK
jgi:hypothetical protein